MAKGTRRTRQSGLVGHLGARGQAAYEEHKDDEVVYSKGGDLPAGITGGIAQLVDLHFGVYGKDTKHPGEYFFYAAGVVVSPKTHDGISVAGQRTSHVEALCDTPESQGKKKTQKDHIAYMLNEFRKLGVEPNKYPDFLGVVEGTIAPAIVKMAPYFRFRTWSMEGSEFVNHDWQGVCDYEEDEQSEDDSVVDETKEDLEIEKHDVPVEDDIPFDRTALATLADEGDEDAQARMTELAEAAGLDLNEYLEQTWVEVDEAMTVADSQGVEQEKTCVYDPEKGEIYRYKRPGTRKLTEYEVTLVSTDDKTVSLKSLDDRKPFKNVSWTKLFDVE